MNISSIPGSKVTLYCSISSLFFSYNACWQFCLLLCFLFVCIFILPPACWIIEHLYTSWIQEEGQCINIVCSMFPFVVKLNWGLCKIVLEMMRKYYSVFCCKT